LLLIDNVLYIITFIAKSFLRIPYLRNIIYPFDRDTEYMIYIIIAVIYLTEYESRDLSKSG